MMADVQMMAKYYQAQLDHLGLLLKVFSTQLQQLLLHVQ